MDNNTLVNKIVAFIVTPIVTALSGFAVVAINNLVDAGLDKDEVAKIAVAVAVLVGAQCINWLRNLHLWQTGQR